MSQPENQTSQAANNSAASNNSFRVWLDALKPEIKRSAPAQISVDRFITGVILQFSQTPRLYDCNKASIAAEIMRAASYGLYLDGQESALVPFKQAAKFMPMVKGLTKLARNSGEIATIVTGVIYEKDRFDFWTDDTGEHLDHKPDIFAEERGERKGAYAMAVLKDGTRMVEVMNKKQIADVKNVSRSKQDSPWDSAFADEMWRKSPFRRLFKRLPSSTDLDLAFKADDELYDLDKPANAETKPDETKPQPGQSSGIAGLVGSHAKPKEEPKPQQQEPPEPPPPEHEFEDGDIPI